MRMATPPLRWRSINQALVTLQRKVDKETGEKVYLEQTSMSLCSVCCHLTACLERLSSQARQASGHSLMKLFKGTDKQLITGGKAKRFEELHLSNDLAPIIHIPADSSSSPSVSYHFAAFRHLPLHRHPSLIQIISADIPRRRAGSESRHAGSPRRRPK